MVLLLLLLALATWSAVLVQICAGPLAWAVPSVPLAATLLVARWSHPGRYRAACLVLGPVAGLAVAGGLLVPTIVLLLLAACAHRTRRWFPVRGLRGHLAYGCVFAFLELGLLLVFPMEGPGLTLEPGGWPWAVAGLLLTGWLFAVLDRLARSWPALAHVLTRP